VLYALPLCTNCCKNPVMVPEESNALAIVMASVAARMRAEFEATRALLHKGGKGAVRERIVRNLVAPYLPGHVRAVGSAEIISADGRRSGQTDVVIHDRAVPPLLDTEDHRLIANECVYLV